MNSLKARLCMQFITGFKYFSDEQKCEIYDGLVKYGLSLKQVKVYAVHSLEFETMRVIKMALARGVSCREMEFCRELDIGAWRMQMIVDGLLAKISPDDIWKYADPRLSDTEAFKIMSSIIKPVYCVLTMRRTGMKRFGCSSKTELSGSVLVKTHMSIAARIV